MDSMQIIGQVSYWKDGADEPIEADQVIEVNDNSEGDTGRIEFSVPLKGATVYLRVNPENLLRLIYLLGRDS